MRLVLKTLTSNKVKIFLLGIIRKIQRELKRKQFSSHVDQGFQMPREPPSLLPPTFWGMLKKGNMVGPNDALSEQSTNSRA